MVRRHVLAALAAGIEAADDNVARSALARIDWILRGRARRLLERALLEAALATKVTDYTEPAAVRHVLRAAALIIRGVKGVELADDVTVLAAHEAHEPRPPATWPIATIVFGLVAFATATTVAAATAYVVTGPKNTNAYERPAPPPPVGVFRHGGTPKRDPAIEAVLGQRFPAVVTTAAVIMRGEPVDEGKRAAMLATLRGDPAMQSHGAELSRAWRDMLDTLGEWLVLKPMDRDWSETSADLRARLDVVSDQLAAAELGYYLDPEILGDHPRRRQGIFTYRIETVAFVRANDAEVRVLELRRLDATTGGAGVLGLTSEEIEDPVVLLDAIDHKIATQVLPILVGAPFPIGEDAWAARRGRPLAQAAGAAIRRELLAALYTDVKSPERATARARQLVVGSVRHHEAQHKLDKGETLAYPLPLARMLPERKNEPFAIRARYELSAYLSQIASDTWLPQLTLFSLSRHAFRRGGPRVEEQLVAVVVVEAMAARLGIPSAGPVMHGGEIDRDRLAALLGPMTMRTTVELRSAAAAAWAELFERPLTRLYD
ncbi:MAG: hypothetical protein H0T46_26700 [Deltaproteobacteria bacterium]|nr:hypothetical protein [Deltaproteobacteria bacterium]